MVCTVYTYTHTPQIVVIWIHRTRIYGVSLYLLWVFDACWVQNYACSFRGAPRAVRPICTIILMELYVFLHADMRICGGYTNVCARASMLANMMVACPSVCGWSARCAIRARDLPAQIAGKRRRRWCAILGGQPREIMFSAESVNDELRARERRCAARVFTKRLDLEALCANGI